jgi:hypothetical protein
VEYALCLTSGAIILLLGIIAGHANERRAWRAHGDALDEHRTPHYCDGEFYYVVPESVFIRDYQRKSLVPPKGGSGTAPARPTVGPKGGTGVPPKRQ